MCQCAAQFAIAIMPQKSVFVFAQRKLVLRLHRLQSGLAMRRRQLWVLRLRRHQLHGCLSCFFYCDGATEIGVAIAPPQFGVAIAPPSTACRDCTSAHCGSCDCADTDCTTFFFFLRLRHTSWCCDCVCVCGLRFSVIAPPHIGLAIAQTLTVPLPLYGSSAANLSRNCSKS